MSNQTTLFDLLKELSTEEQELLTGGQNTGLPPGFPGTNNQTTPPGTNNQTPPPGTNNQPTPPFNPQRRGATGYIVPDDNPRQYYTWRLDSV
ncbi:hypothetical protein A0J48_014895 [Sphaerospermopsis aphanizomenoides BCCUSP55]|uniref:hypothetical protein n=1 Tax=Sphaerospermopsis aphanizomenoides TaxID=459663 RepID=UPI001904877A|nr:hypothetical protein [Sphaerospermopsis aphanizomenoides]MBK1988808.1 hypothetical protein [Sphaerospermopsis aphanizomenoides BCCUSP55]